MIDDTSDNPEMEPRILPFRPRQEADPPPDGSHDSPPRPDDREALLEAFWAGRNHAMRRSARVAA
jgi:hypothetical protein